MDTLAGYRILAELGSGSYGRVFRAIQEELDREVALKVLARGAVEDPESRARFLREARLQARLSHPCLLEVYDAGLSREGAYLAMELAEGGSLRALLTTEGRPRSDVAIRMLRDVARGLAHAHEASILHRDLKPENVLLTAARRVKVGDFGLAKSTAGRQTLLTSPDQVMGTPGYIAPEALLGHEVQAAADVYAWGAMAFEMLCGRRPYPGADVPETLRLQIEGLPVADDAFPQELPAPVRALVRRCLSRRPEDRPESAVQLLPFLDELLESGFPPERGGNASAPSGAAVPERAGARKTVRLAQSRPRPAAGMSPPTVQLGVAPASLPPRAGFPIRPLAFGAIAAALGLAAAYLGIRSSFLPPEAVSAVVAAPAPAMPRVTAVSSSATRLRIWLDRPAPPGVRIRWARKGEPAGGVRRLPAGASACLLEGLSHSAEYDVRLERGDEAVSTAARTRWRLGVSGATVLASGLWRPVYIVGGSSGDRVALAWYSEDEANPRDRELYFVESHDRGDTWGPADSRDDGHEIYGEPALLLDGPDTWATYFRYLPTPEGVLGRLELLYRAAGDRAWTHRRMANVAHGSSPRILKIPGVGLRLLVPGKGGLRLVGLDEPLPPRDEQIGEGFPHYDASLAAVGPDGSIGAVVAQFDSGDGNRISFSSAPVSAGSTQAGPFRELLAIASGSPRSRDMEILAGPDRWVTAYCKGDSVYVSTLPYGGNSVRTATAPNPRRVEQKSPAIARVGNTFYLCLLGYSVIPTLHRLFIYSLEDGASEWVPVAERDIDIGDLDRTWLFAFSDKLLVAMSDRLQGVSILTFEIGRP